MAAGKSVKTHSNKRHDMFLVDTSVVSFFIRNNSLKELYRPEMEGVAPLYLSVQTIAEIVVGAERDNWGAPRLGALKMFIAKQFAVIPIDENTVSFYAAAINGSARLGRALTVPDGWIVATAKQHDLTLVTHDLDMRVGEQLGVKIVCRA